MALTDRERDAIDSFIRLVMEMGFSKKQAGRLTLWLVRDLRDLATF